MGISYRAETLKNDDGTLKKGEEVAKIIQNQGVIKLDLIPGAQPVAWWVASRSMKKLKRLAAPQTRRGSTSKASWRGGAANRTRPTRETQCVQPIKPWAKAASCLQPALVPNLCHTIYKS